MNEELERKRPINVTRDDLYRQVWETPMTRLAAQYGITGNGLAKICERLNVPYPPRGYWAKKAAGRNVITYQLPPGAADTPQSVGISPTLPKVEPTALPSEITAKADEARSASASMVVPERLARPHPIIASWLAEHDRRKREARKERDPWLKQLADSGCIAWISRHDIVPNREAENSRKIPEYFAGTTRAAANDDPGARSRNFISSGFAIGNIQHEFLNVAGADIGQAPVTE